jgi:hypothetical protein
VVQAVQSFDRLPQDERKNMPFVVSPSNQPCVQNVLNGLKALDSY